MLSDLFSINGQYTFQINILRLLLKLNNGFRNEKDDFVSGTSSTLTYTMMIMLTFLLNRFDHDNL